MRYNPEIHHRRSIRLKGYDYSQEGFYFVTVCTQGRRCLFGEIENNRLILNDAGKMIERWWNELKNKYANIEIDEYVVMPNHCHGIIKIVDGGGNPNNGTGGHIKNEMGGHAGPPQPGSPQPGSPQPGSPQPGSPQPGSPQPGSPVQENEQKRPLCEMIQWFKTMTTNEYIRNVKQNHWEPFEGKLWQRDYYEHIIRNESSLRNIREYIVNNPCQWQQDDLFV